LSACWFVTADAVRLRQALPPFAGLKDAVGVAGEVGLDEKRQQNEKGAEREREKLAYGDEQRPGTAERRKPRQPAMMAAAADVALLCFRRIII